jgi:beta-barrel assembly-enhancing protease
MLRRHFIPLVACSLIASVAAWARNPGDPLKPGWNLFSRDQDINIGARSALQVRMHYAEVHDRFLDDYIRSIGDRLAATPEARQGGFRFTFTMLNVPQVNAFALPGGPMFIFTGLLKATDNEAQLAGVMAHEMSHVILRHGTHEASKAKTVKLLSQLAGAAAGGNTSAAGQLAGMGLGLGANSFILHFSREAESEADALGSHLMAEAGYNPIEMAHFFEKLAYLTTQGSQFFSDHPSPGNREKAIEAEIRALPQREYGFETGQFQRAKEEIASLGPPGSNATLSNLPPLAPPPASWRLLKGSLYAVAFPADWSVYGQANPSVTITPPDAVTKNANGTAVMSAGAKADYYDPGPNLSIGTATLKLVGYLHDRNPNIQVLATEQQKSVRVNQSEGLITPLRGISPTGAPEMDVLLTVARPQGVFYMIFTSPQASFLQYQRTFEQMIDSVRFNQ